MAVWQPLLQKNFGLPPETDGVVLDQLPDLLFSHGASSCTAAGMLSDVLVCLSADRLCVCFFFLGFCWWRID